MPSNTSSISLVSTKPQQLPAFIDRQAGQLTDKLQVVSSSFARPTFQGSIKEKLQNNGDAPLFNRHLTKVASEMPRGIIYSFFSSEDMVIQAMSLNTGRALKGKPLLPLCCASKNLEDLNDSIGRVVKKELEGRLKGAAKSDKVLWPHIEAANKSGNDSATLDQLFKFRPKEVKEGGEYRALTQLCCIDPATLDEKSIDTVYVIGHGEAGRPSFFSVESLEGERISASGAMREIGKTLAGKMKSAVKIKITSCYSADGERLQSIDKISDEAPKNSNLISPLALSAKKEVSKYFPEAKVFGCHGLGISRGWQYIGEARCGESEYDDATGSVSNFVKPSLVRREF